MNERLLSLVADCGPLHLGDNRSRHSPIIVKLNLGAIQVKQEVLSKIPRRPAWYKANYEHTLAYTEYLDSRVQNIKVPHSLSCLDPNCTLAEHSDERDSLVMDLLVSLIESCHINIPMVGGKTVKSGSGKDRSDRFPGWKEEVVPFQDDARFWYSMWSSAGRPTQGVLHRVMASTRNKYHYAIRRARKKADLFRAQKFFEASETGSMDLLHEMKNIRNRGKKTSPDLPDCVEGANGEEEVVGKFREVYSNLYNSWGSEDDMLGIKRQVADLVNSENSAGEILSLTGQVVKNAAMKMKPAKADVSESFTSEAVLHAPDSFFDLLALVFRSWMVHGTVTLSLLACAFLPLLKSRLKDPASTNSYRAIAGSSLLLKLFDLCVLQLWGHLLASDSLQFGYKEGTGTVQCSWLVMEVANHYLRAGSQPIMTLLDCSKAFDMVKYNILFTKLLDRDLPAVVVRTLIVVYEKQYALVRWGKVMSEFFPII